MVNGFASVQGLPQKADINILSFLIAGDQSNDELLPARSTQGTSTETETFQNFNDGDSWEFRRAITIGDKIALSISDLWNRNGHSEISRRITG